MELNKFAESSNVIQTFHTLIDNKGKIMNLLQQNAVIAETILVNATYFKALWLNPFTGF